ncbi:hypothetical protein Pmar_PMAR010090 [Perkinsus marinus ATCC 50983]|uniref:Uncharacterized protein n=1 Tax=Perkinsus marinus (strain ATCC 50983 / TXsc) TaxID=423536 RepID=C5K4T3_PERM5|nr:hypothetical protein Pmar_PMAR010090 [Perkinsus marinus ATCC 50983]EER20355.1 hypothetical protein Pmar_PMAR010090 [Perkinsus marinus ATCC 50983]|eukprot:XP_002788559.1 hypothetical protein Pmar_PMAR010090 [Perkinsus marinus ATCC 50983]
MGCAASLICVEVHEDEDGSDKHHTNPSYPKKILIRACPSSRRCCRTCYSSPVGSYYSVGSTICGGDVQKPHTCTKPPLYGGSMYHTQQQDQQQQQQPGRYGRRLHYTTTPLTPIHELREMTSSEMSDYCPTVVSSSEATEEPYRPVIVDSVDRRWKSRRRSDPSPRRSSRRPRVDSGKDRDGSNNCMRISAF